MSLSLRGKTFIVVALVLISVFTIVFISINSLINNIFDRSENIILAEEKIAEFKIEFQSYLEGIAEWALEEAYWDQAYSFMQGEGEATMLLNYNDGIEFPIDLAEGEIDRMMYFSLTIAENPDFWQTQYPQIDALTVDHFNTETIEAYGEAVINERIAEYKIEQLRYYNDGTHVLLDLEVDAEGNSIRPLTSLFDYLTPELLMPPLDPESTSGTLGILMLPEAPIIIASFPVLPETARDTPEDSTSASPPLGTLIIAEYIDQDLIDRIEFYVDGDQEFYRLDEQNTSLSPDNLPELQRAWDISIQQVDENTLTVFTVLEDIRQQPALIWEIVIQLPNINFARPAIRAVYTVLLIVGIIFLVLSLILLEIFVLRPLTGLERQVHHIGLEGDMSNRLKIRGKDEVARLAQKINAMLEALSGALTRERVLKEREKVLTSELKALRIEIDHVKKKQQVEEITSTSYFQDLQDRAKAMRQRKTKPPEESES